MLRTNQFTTTFINGGANWKYSDAGQDLATEWAQPGYDDSSWSNGVARFGYGDLATATQVSFGSDPNNKIVTTYFRRSVVVPWNAVVTNLNLRIARTGGVVAWLNVQELFRTNLPTGPLTASALALAATTGYNAYMFYPVDIPVTGLPPGTNLVAVELHQSSVTNSTLGFDMELIGSGYLLPTPSLSIKPADGNFQLSWPFSNGYSFNLYSTTNPATTGSWTFLTTPAQTNGGQIVVTQTPDTGLKFFRLQRP